MSSSVDQRIVELQFNNKEFEQNIQTTLTSLDELKKKLDLGDDTSRSFDQLQRAANKLSLDNVTSAIQGVTDKLNAMTSIAGMAINKIKSQIASMAVNLAKSVTIAPLASGLQEYETQMDSTQTIYSNVKNAGKSLQDVTDALDELNTYADKTIYNFTQMTHSIGMFTTAGVGLETSVKSIKGISNLAALMGADANAANRAMYNLSQAMSSGSVRLTDWMSIENANMGGKNFQEMLIKSAKLHGVNYDKLEKKYGSFRNTLSTGWLTADIMNDVLENLQLVDSDATEAQLEAARELLRNKGYSEEDVEYFINMSQTASDAATKVKTFTQLIDTLKEALGSGWAFSWRTIIGDYEEAKELFTSWSDELGGLIEANSDARNRILTAWKTLGGRDALISGISNLYNTAKTLFGKLGEGVMQVLLGGFASGQALDQRGKDLADFSKQLEEGTQALLSWANGANAFSGTLRADELAEFGRGVGDLCNILFKAIELIGSGIGDLIGRITGLTDVPSNLLDLVLEFGAVAGRAVEDLYGNLKNAKNLGEFFAIIGDAIAKGWNQLTKTLRKLIRGDAETGEEGLLDRLKKWWLGEDTNGDGEIDIEGVLKSGIRKWAKDTCDTVKKWLWGVSEDESKDGVGSKGIIPAIKDWWLGEDTNGDGEVDAAGFLARIKAWGTALWTKAKEYIESGKALEDLKALPGVVANALNGLLESVGLPENAFTGFLEKTSKWFSDLWSKIVGWISNLNFGDFNVDLSGAIASVGEFFKGIWEAIKGLFSGGGEEVADGDAEQVGGTLEAISGIADALQSSKGFSLKGLATDTIKGAIDFVSEIINYLLDVFPFNRIIGLIALFKGAVGIGQVSGGIKSFGKGVETIGKGFETLALSKAGVEIEQEKSKFDKFMEALQEIGKTLLLIAASVLLIAIAAQKFDTISLGGFFTMILAIGAIFAGIYLLDKYTNTDKKGRKNLTQVGVAMAGIAIALFACAVSIAILGSLPFPALVQGCAATVILLFALGFLTVELTKYAAKGNDKGLAHAGKTMLLLAAAITLLTIPIFILGAMPLNMLVQGGVVVALLAVVLVKLTTMLSNNCKQIPASVLVSIAVLTLCVTALAAVAVVLAMLPTGRLIQAGIALVAIAGVIVGLGFALSALGAQAGPMLIGAAAFAGALIIIAAGIGAAMAILAAFLAGASNNLYKMAISLAHVSESFAAVDGDGIQNGVEAFGKIKEMITSAIGIDTSGYDEIASRLTPMGVKLKLFSRSTSAIDPEAGTKAETLAENIKNIYLDLNQVGSLSDYDSLSTCIADMGAALMLFAENTAEGEVTDQSIKNSGRIGEILTALATALPEASVFDEISQFADDSEGSNLTNMSLGIVNLATAMSDYSDEAKKIDTEAVGKVNAVVDDLVDIQGKLKGEGTGPFGWFKTQYTGGALAAFSEAIVALGTAMGDFQESVPTDATASQTAVDIAERLSDLQEKLLDSTERKSIWDFFKGGEGLDEFGQNIEALGGYLGGFATAIEGTDIDGEKVTSAVGVLDSISAIQVALTGLDKGGLRIGDLGWDLKSLGGYMNNFFESVTEHDFSDAKVGAATSALDALADIQVKIGNFGKNTGLRIGDLGYDLTNLPGQLHTFYEGLDEYSLTSGETTDITTAFSTMLIGLGQGFSDFVANVQAGVTTLGTLKTTAFNSGVYITQGLIDGLAEGEANVYKTAYGLGLIAIKGINKGADINSPSKLAAKSGMYIDMGMASGLAQYSGLVMDAGEKVSEDAISMMDRFSSAVTANINDQPVIRPVLDLSELQNGSAAINGMFSSGYGINPGYISPPSYLRSERYGDSDRSVSSGSSNLGSAVQQLSEKVNQLGDRIMSMQLVLDSGELVGGIAEQMDNELGARTTRKVRGN